MKPRPAITALEPARDEQGRLVIGENAGPCRWCGAPEVTTVSACGKLVWKHPPVRCCPKKGTPGPTHPHHRKPYKE